MSIDHMSKDSNSLKKILDNAKDSVAVGARYQHYKEGEYIVLDIVLNEANLEPLVIYQAQYGERLTFARPISNWLENVTNNGTTQPRFSKVS